LILPRERTQSVVNADARAAAKQAPSAYVLTMAALASARTDDIAEPETLAGELDTKFPQVTVVQRYRLPAVLAAIALQ
jgi:hypothetical protein